VPRNGLNEPRTGRIVAQLLPDVLDALRQGALRDDHVIPYLREEPVLLDELSVFAHKKSERIELAGVEVERPAASPELSIGYVENDVGDAKNLAFDPMLTGRSDGAHAAHRIRRHITCSRPRLQRADGAWPAAVRACSRRAALRNVWGHRLFETK
jgi:hypothetical protein